MPKPFVPNKTCGNCSAWTRLQPLMPAGMCRANPPTPVGLGLIPGPGGKAVPVVERYFPTTLDIEWCRDGWQLRVPDELPAVDLSKIDAETIEGSA